MRHGKSSWEYDVSDKDRPLKERGISDADLVAKKFVTQKIVPDAIFSSPANRALHTGIIFLRNMGYDLSVLKIQEELYDFSGNQVSKFIKGLDNKLGTAMIFGHNYALQIHGEIPILKMSLLPVWSIFNSIVTNGPKLTREEQNRRFFQNT